jgi:AcrR family transcriptional regulator
VAGERVYGGRSAEQRRTARWEQLLAAGRERFADDGWADATVAGICRTAGVSPRYFYEHVEDREALFLAVVERIADEVEQVVRGAAATDGADPVQRARLVLEGVAAYFAADPRAIRVALIESLATRDFRARRRQLLARFAELGTRLMGALRERDDTDGSLPAAAGFSPGSPHAGFSPGSPHAGMLLTGGLVELLIAWATEEAGSPSGTSPGEAVDDLVVLATAVARL